MQSNHHDHHHHHHSHHHGDGTRTERNLLIAFLLNFGFAIIEFIGGILTNSIAIQSDALHDFGDSLSLAFALVMERLSKGKPSSEFSYGYARLRVFGALVTGLILVIGAVIMLVRSWERLLNPESVQIEGMLLLAVCGVAVNLVAFFRLQKGQSLQEKVIVMHLLEDAFGWIIVLLGAVVMYFNGPIWIDSLLSIGLSLWIIVRVFTLLKSSATVLMQAEPHSSNAVITAIKAVDGVIDVHHLHLWSLDGEKHILNLHVVVPEAYDWPKLALLKGHIRHQLSHLGRYEVTIEFEHPAENCSDPKHEL